MAINAILNTLCYNLTPIGYFRFCCSPFVGHFANVSAYSLIFIGQWGFPYGLFGVVIWALWLRTSPPYGPKKFYGSHYGHSIGRMCYKTIARAVEVKQTFYCNFGLLKLTFLCSAKSYDKTLLRLYRLLEFIMRHFGSDCCVLSNHNIKDELLIVSYSSIRQQSCPKPT